MAEQLAVWHAEHVSFARLLDLLEKEVATFHEGGRPNYELMLDIVHYMRTFSDRYHHPREDAAFAKLVARDPKWEIAIARLNQEHRVLANAGEELRHHLDEALDDVPEPRSVLEAAAATYIVYYRAHLGTEEREIMPRAAQLLTAQDWAEVAASAPAVTDPIASGDLLERLRNLRAGANA